MNRCEFCSKDGIMVSVYQRDTDETPNLVHASCREAFLNAIQKRQTSSGGNLSGKMASEFSLKSSDRVASAGEALLGTIKQVEEDEDENGLFFAKMARTEPNLDDPIIQKLIQEIALESNPEFWLPDEDKSDTEES